MNKEVILELKNLCKYFPLKEGFFSFKKSYFKALEKISLTLEKGETLGIVGESGCGKSTLGKSILRLNEINSGKILFKGQDITKLNFAQLRAIRPSMQMIFQDPYSSLNPRMTILKTLMEPLLVHKMGSKEECYKKVLSLIDKVGLDRSSLAKYPANFSGGQRQRIAIARALCLNPELIVADEPVSALDVSIQSQILNLFIDLREEFGFSCLFISHDLAVVEYISDKIAVIYLGQIVEYGSKENIFSKPKHPYTKALLSSIPTPVYRPDRKIKSSLTGELHKDSGFSGGCSFYTRCSKASKVCKENEPMLREVQAKVGCHQVSCHNSG